MMYPVALTFAAWVATVKAIPLLDVTTQNTFVSFPFVHTRLSSGYSSILNSSPHTAVGSVSAINEMFSYIVTVTIGGHPYYLIMDTGSSITWVGADQPYIKTKTSHCTGELFNVTYGSGSAVGFEYIDKLSIGGLTVTKQSIGVATNTLGFAGVDGILGFGPTILTYGMVKGEELVPTVMDNLYLTNAISEEVFGVYFKPISGNKTEETNGEITLGGVDPSKYTGHMTYVPTTHAACCWPYWGIDIGKVSFGGRTIGKNLHAIVDTGTTLIYLPLKVYSAFVKANHGSLDKANNTVFETKPSGTFTITIGDKDFPLTPEQYLIPKAQYENLELYGNKYYTWFSTFGPTNATDVDFILGQKFLENYYSVFDITNSRVGLAKRT